MADGFAMALQQYRKTLFFCFVTFHFLSFSRVSYTSSFPWPCPFCHSSSLLGGNPVYVLWAGIYLDPRSRLLTSRMTHYSVIPAVFPFRYSRDLLGGNPVFFIIPWSTPYPSFPRSFHFVIPVVCPYSVILEVCWAGIQYVHYSG